MRIRFAVVVATATTLCGHFSAGSALADCPSSPGPCALSRVASFSYADNSDNSKDKLTIKMSKGESTSPSAFGDPTATTTYDVCIYQDDIPGVPITLPVDGDCSDGACWTSKPKGPGYKDKAGSNSGITGVKLIAVEGVDKTTVLVSGRGEGLPDLTVPVTQPLAVQVRNDMGGCWGAIFSGDGLVQNTDKGTIKGVSRLDTFPSCSDGVKNGWETDVDCGGGCADCGYMQACLGDSDCVSGTCSSGTCAASCDDGTQNGDETATDCGGSCTTKCAYGYGCSVASDCETDICRNGSCSAKLVFVTSATYEGDFGGLTAGDTLCNAQAGLGGLGSTWTAWLSDSGTSAINRIVDQQYLNLQGQVAFTDKAQMSFGFSYNSIGYDQYGMTIPESARAWTGSNASGLAGLHHCNNWQSTGYDASVGQPANTGKWSLDGPDPAACTYSFRLICFEN